MKKILVFLGILITASLIMAVSIWDDRKADVYSKKINYGVGETVLILITEDASYEYKASGKAFKSNKIEIKGGEATGMFDFLPTGSSEVNESANTRDGLKIRTSIPARIIAVNNDIATIQGTKNVIINNRVSNVTIRGEVNISDIRNGEIYSTKLTNSTISIVTLLDNNKNVLTERDLQEVLVNPDLTSDTRTKNVISKEKQKELLLRYFNKILNTIF